MLGSMRLGHGAPLRTDWDMDHGVVRGQLDKMKGTAFAITYMRAHIEDHHSSSFTVARVSRVR
jgi:hypothetical protein